MANLASFFAWDPGGLSPGFLTKVDGVILPLGSQLTTESLQKESWKSLGRVLKSLGRVLEESWKSLGRVLEESWTRIALLTRRPTSVKLPPNTKRRTTHDDGSRSTGEYFGHALVSLH